MPNELPSQFRDAFFESLRTEDLGNRLKESALDGRLIAWTSALTTLTAIACQHMKWRASAKGHSLDLLPVQRSEYLGLDVVAFGDGEKRWRFPAAVFELENQQREDFIAYSLWKILSVRTDLRVLFCYRRRPELAASLLKHLRQEVVEAMGLAGRIKLDGETMLVIGSRSESETFPFGFFNWWRLNTNTGSFEKF